MAPVQPQALLFDLGRVLIDFDFRRAFRSWQPMSRLSLGEIERAFKFDSAYEQHERGEITSWEYFAHLRSTLKLADDLGRIESGWNSIFTGEIAETRRMVEAASLQLPCYVLSNTNAAHQSQWMSQFPTLSTLFGRIFVSHEIGVRKPEKEAFDHALNAIGMSAKSILFFDDLLENVEGARAAGLMAVHVRSPEDVKDALVRSGCQL